MKLGDGYLYHYAYAYVIGPLIGGLLAGCFHVMSAKAHEPCDDRREFDSAHKESMISHH